MQLKISAKEVTVVALLGHSGVAEVLKQARVDHARKAQRARAAQPNTQAEFA